MKVAILSIFALAAVAAAFPADAQAASAPALVERAVQGAYEFNDHQLVRRGKTAEEKLAKARQQEAEKARKKAEEQRNKPVKDMDPDEYEKVRAAAIRKAKQDKERDA